MDFKLFLEQLESSIKLRTMYGERDINIYSNPTRQEIGSSLSADKEIRFIADNATKTFYVFSFDLLHAKAAEKLGIEYYSNDNALFGNGVLNGFKIDDLEYFSLAEIPINKAGDAFIKKLVNTDWSWTSKYTTSIKTSLERYIIYRDSQRKHF